MTEKYNDLEWNISETPIGSSTPDEFVEYSYRARAVCSNCGNEISGTANYWTDGARTWLEYIDYELCGCERNEKEEDDDDDIDE